MKIHPEIPAVISLGVLMDIMVIMYMLQMEIMNIDPGELGNGVTLILNLLFNLMVEMKFYLLGQI